MSTEAMPEIRILDYEPNSPMVRQRARPGPRSRQEPDPIPQRVTVDGHRALAIPLYGYHGQGRRVLVDPDAWAGVVRSAGAVWTLCSNNKDKFYVRSGTKLARSAARKAGAAVKASLSAIIMSLRAPTLDNEAVAYRNGDPCDLRSANLEVILKRNRQNYRPKCPPVVVVDGWHDA